MTRTTSQRSSTGQSRTLERMFWPSLWIESDHGGLCWGGGGRRNYPINVFFLLRSYFFIPALAAATIRTHCSRSLSLALACCMVYLCRLKWIDDANPTDPERERHSSRGENPLPALRNAIHRRTSFHHASQREQERRHYIVSSILVKLYKKTSNDPWLLDGNPP